MEGIASICLIISLSSIFMQTDMAKRLRATSEKKTKLVNPLFFISPVRLSIRNLNKMIGNDSDLSVASTPTPLY